MWSVLQAIFVPFDPLRPSRKGPSRALVFFVALGGCGHAPEPVAPARPSPLPVVVPESPPEADPDALSEEDRACIPALRRDAAHLVEMGPRNEDHPLGLADATDWLFLWAEGTGRAARRVGFSTPSGVGQNLELVVAGDVAERPSVVVTVPYDSPAGDADFRAATAAAFQMEFARRILERPLRAPLVLVWLSHTDAAALEAETSGSFAYAKQARIRKDAFELVINLRFVDASATSVVLIGNGRSQQAMERLTKLFELEQGLSVQTQVEPRGSGDAIAFERVEYPTLLLNLGLPKDGDVASESAARWLGRLVRVLRAFAEQEQGQAKDTGDPVGRAGGPPGDEGPCFSVTQQVRSHQGLQPPRRPPARGQEPPERQVDVCPHLGRGVEQGLLFATRELAEQGSP